MRRDTPQNRGASLSASCPQNVWAMMMAPLTVRTKMQHRIAYKVNIMQSAWEKLTGGLCNAGLTEKPAKFKPKKKPTARQMKDQGMFKAARAEAKFDKLDALNNIKGPEAKKAKRQMADRWDKRADTNPGAMHKPGKPAPCFIVKGQA